VAKAPTIYEVAERAGVSISTVSNALNRPDRVSSATRDAVLRAADELGYVPKPAAVIQARKGLGRIGVLAPFTSYASFFRRLSGVMTQLQDQPFEVTVFDIESAATSSSPVLAASAIRGRLDGLIVMGERIDPAVEARLFDREMPTVVVDAESDRFPVITTDDVRGGAIAAEHLYNFGHRKIGYLIEQQVSDYESQARRRLNGFCQALEERSQVDITVAPTGRNVAQAKAAARLLLSGANRPTAVMAHFDDLAVGALQAARELGLRVPEDVSVMGFDDGPMAEACGLTTVRQPLEETGVLAARLLVAEMAHGGPRTVTMLDCQLVSRSSTAAPLVAEGDTSAAVKKVRPKRRAEARAGS
jgi:LacI family transcriptional regulator